MIALDASVLISHFKSSDSHHNAATEFFRNTLTEDFIVHPITLAEVLVAGVRTGRGAEMLGEIESLNVRCSAPGVGEPLRLATLRVSTGLKMPDCCVLDCALSNDAAIATFDKTMARAAERLHVDIAN